MELEAMPEVKTEANTMVLAKKEDLIPKAQAKIMFEAAGDLGVVKVKEQKSSEPRPIHDGSPQQQEYIDYAWDISKDKTFIYLLKAENGMVSPDLKHYTPHYACDNSQGITVNASNCNAGKKGFYWKKHYDWGFCGTSDSYKGHIQRDPRFFSDWKWQMEQCYEMYKGGTTFYGRKNIPKVKKFFTWK